MNSSFLITSNKRFDGNSFLIPNTMNIKGIRLKSAIINLPEINVRNHVAYRLFSDENSDEPSPNIKEEFRIPDGYYTQEQYASKLSELLSVRASGEYHVKFHEPTGKMTFEFVRNPEYVNNTYISFNEEASDYLGVDDEKWIQFKKFFDTEFEAPRKLLQLPRYYWLRRLQVNVAALLYPRRGWYYRLPGLILLNVMCQQLRV